jgi:hypothetical protein
VTFSAEKITALSREIDASASLLRHGFLILADEQFASRDSEPLFACLAGGAEKLLKLTFGLMTVDEGGDWPSIATMQHAGHKITELDATARRLLVERQSRSTQPDLIRHLLAATEGHPGVIQVLATLERYAVEGRFFNLDLLGGRAQGKASPAELWHELEMDIVEANPEMIDQSATGEYEQVRQTMDRIIASSLGIWCELLLQSWTTGVCGPLALQRSPQLELGHPSPRALPKHTAAGNRRRSAR